MQRGRLAPGELEQAFARADQLRLQAGRAERLASRRIETLACGLATRMEPGMHFHRSGVGLHAFDVGGTIGLAAAYLEQDAGGYHYRYAVLCGGDAGRRALRDAALDPGDSDEPGPGRQIWAASYADHVDFVDRLPTFLTDLERTLERRARAADAASAKAADARRQLRRTTGGGPDGAVR